MILTISGIIQPLFSIFTHPSEWIQRTAAQEKYIMFRSTINPNSTVQNGSIYSLDVCIAIVSMLRRYNVCVTFAICDTCIFVHVWSLWNLVCKEKSFWKKRIHDEHTFGWSDVCLSVDNMCELSDLINNAISTQVAMFIADGSIYYPVGLSEALMSDTFRGYFWIVLIFFWLILILAADVKSQFRKNLRDLTIHIFRKRIPKDDGIGEYLTIMEDHVAIKGTRRFTIDLAFLGTVRS